MQITRKKRYIGAYMASNQGKHNSGSAAKDMAVWNSPKNKSFWNNTAIQRGIAGALFGVIGRVKAKGGITSFLPKK